MTATGETLRLTEAAARWGRARWPGCRVIRELVLGERRVDLAFVCDRDIIGMEIKSATDTLGRLSAQIKEFWRYVPEVWVAIDPKWQDREEVRYAGVNKIVVGADNVVTEYRQGQKPYRDELVCSRLLELLWYEEACSIAVRTDVIPVRVQKQIRKGHVLKMLARLLTGNEILSEVCRELRARPLVGIGSDAAMRTEIVSHNQRFERKPNVLC